MADQLEVHAAGFPRAKQGARGECKFGAESTASRLAQELTRVSALVVSSEYSMGLDVGRFCMIQVVSIRCSLSNIVQVVSM